MDNQKIATHITELTSKLDDTNNENYYLEIILKLTNEAKMQNRERAKTIGEEIAFLQTLIKETES